MRTITAHLFSSADGVVESPNLFQFDSFDAESGQAMGRVLAQTDAAILGRVLYDEWIGYFPHAQSDPFADWINPVPKYVASRTLSDSLGWQNAEVIKGDLLDFVRELKQTEGGAVAVNGISVIQQLLAAGLIDSLTLTVHPVIAGSGRKIFGDLDSPLRMRLIDSEITSKGNAILTYAPHPG